MEIPHGGIHVAVAGNYRRVLEAHPMVQQLGDSGVPQHVGPDSLPKTGPFVGLPDDGSHGLGGSAWSR